jgi:hypothetical protein
LKSRHKEGKEGVVLGVTICPPEQLPPMPLTDTAICNVKSGPKPVKMFDERVPAAQCQLLKVSGASSSSSDRARSFRGAAGRVWADHLDALAAGAACGGRQFWQSCLSRS